MQRMYMKKKQ